MSEAGHNGHASASANVTSRFGLARGRLTRRFAVAFAGVALLTAALAALLLSVVWAAQFDAYVRDGLRNTASGAATLLSRFYSDAGGWTLEAFAQMPRFGIMSGLGLQVLDVQGDVIYDDSVMGGMAQGMVTQVPAVVTEPTGQVETAPVTVDDEVVGVIRVWPLSPEGLLTKNDIAFRRSSFIGLAVAAVVAVALASLAGFAFATGLVRPIDRITETAEALRGGDRDARTGVRGDDAIGLLGMTFDEMADAIEADRELERRLTADVAHELRTPLQAIQATVEAMQDGVLPADDERLAVVRDETVRLARLADGILELTRLERGSTPMRHERLAADAPVRAAIDAHRALIESCELELIEDITPGLLVMGDRDRLTQAVGNLLSNAARYTPEGGRIEVSLRMEGDRAVIKVSDTGVGIAEEDTDRVFSRFWRADSARGASTGGLGIGLAIVKEIIERHGGVAAAERLTGGGTAFTLRLPLAS
ncbi:MAG: HAMP domain-containing sensor histidine kinase [Coriobacteriia bacterium]|nr:HAMP domain-containing sensor histidine kinase [Coriobacteriia bacterium]